jgi:hypothetical protein
MTPWFHLKREEQAQARLKAWVARALDITDVAVAHCSQREGDRDAPDPKAARLLLRVACILLRNWRIFERLERSLALSGPETSPGKLIGVPLGIYLQEGEPRTVALRSADEFEELPRAKEPDLIAGIFEDGAAPPPAVRMTPRRAAAIQRGLARMLEYAARDILSPLVLLGGSDCHPILARAREVRARADASGLASDADWELKRPATAATSPLSPRAATERPWPPPAPPRQSRCHFCRKPLGADFVRRTDRVRVERRRWGAPEPATREIVRVLHPECFGRQASDEQLLRYFWLGVSREDGRVLAERYTVALRRGRVRVMCDGATAWRWPAPVTPLNAQAAADAMRRFVTTHSVMKT